jgi:hypothetical protein
VTSRYMGIALVALLAGCGLTQSPVVANKEDMLADSGFTPRRADTAERVAVLRKLPAYTLVHQQRNGVTVWAFADPTICGCVYVGGQKAYDAYKAKLAARQLKVTEDERTLEPQLAAWPMEAFY